MESKIFKGGVLFIKIGGVLSRSVNASSVASSGLFMQGTAIAGGTIVAPMAWTFAGICFLAQTGSNYRKMQKGSMTRSQFHQETKNGAVGTVGGIGGASGGAAAGFLLGSALFPVVGSFIGTIGGAVLGGIIGRRLSLKALDKIENKLAAARSLRTQQANNKPK